MDRLFYVLHLLKLSNNQKEIRVMKERLFKKIFM